MPTYTFTGINSRGYPAFGSGKYNSENELARRLDGRDISEYTIFKSETDCKPGLYALAGPEELSILLKQMWALYYSHMPFSEGLSLLAKENGNKNLKAALNEICSIIEEGYSFTTAMNMYDNVFPTYLLNMLSIGEQSGTLDTVLQTMSDYYGKEGKLRKRLRQALIYPAVLAVLTGIVIMLLIVKVLPVFNGILTDMGGEIPAGAAFVFGLGGFLNKYFWIFGLIIVVLAAGLFAYTRTEKGRTWYDKFKLSSFITKFIAGRSVSARVAKSLSLLLRSGVPIPDAMGIVIPVIENEFAEDKFIKAAKDVNEGKELSAALGSAGIFPPLFLKMVTIGERTGNLDEMLDKAGSVFDDEAEEAILRFMAMAEPVLTIILSVIAGIILLTVMMPMINILTSF